jgi:hypothetical protein
VRRINLTGLRSGRLLVLGQAGHSRGGRLLWECLCDCGSRVDVVGYSLTSGRTKTCGCVGSRFRHGLSNTRTHMIWAKMKYRCSNPRSDSFYLYGARGIRVCKRWAVFENFIADMGSAPKGLTLDRINNNGPYSPANCRWATRREQSGNTRRNKIITCGGVSMILADWARVYRMSPYVINSRLRLGWEFKQALTTPVGQAS